MSFLFLIMLILLLGIGVYHNWKKLPEGLSLESPEYSAGDVRFFRDLTWIDPQGRAQHDHQIFDEVVGLVKGSQRFILLDMFLYNNLRGAVDSGYRNLSAELTDALLEQKKKYPAIKIILVTDPINTVYGGYVNPYFQQLKQAGIDTVVTDLDALRDSNFFYSPFWRLFVRPFGNSPGGIMPNPFGPGKVTMRSYLRMFNFKANHRKLIVADHGDDLAAVVTSANPHDGSSSHGNVGIGFSGPAAQYLLASEEAVIRFTDGGRLPGIKPAADGQSSSGPGIRVLTENKIKEVYLAELAQTVKGDHVLMVMFYLADREVIAAMKDAVSRGVLLQIVLDPNKDAFGRTKNGVPNRQVAAELVEKGIAVRWGNTHGEQLHSKMMLVEYGDGMSSLLVGSANLTRRNLENYNLETNVQVRGKGYDSVFEDARDYFELLWSNDSDRVFSLEYSSFEDDSKLRVILYRLIEATGLCTF